MSLEHDASTHQTTNLFIWCVIQSVTNIHVPCLSLVDEALAMRQIQDGIPPYFVICPSRHQSLCILHQF